MNGDQLLISLLILTPFIGSLITLLFQNALGKHSKFIGLITVGISASTSLIMSIQILNDDWEFEKLHLTEWIGYRTYQLDLVVTSDSLSVFMALIASFLGLLIVLFSFEYMEDDDHLPRYWFFLQLFIAGMNLLVMAGDLILLYTGWELVGLCSFGLISHWHRKEGEDGEKSAQSGLKAFLLTRIGDIGLLAAIIIIYVETNTVVFSELQQYDQYSNDFIDFVSILFLVAAFGKSAQIPFTPWLSSPEGVDIDAMQAPTTVSALIHAATMVKAGVYLISRMYFVFPFYQSELFVNLLIIVAASTAIVTACSALVVYDLKRILAFSTASQLAYMFLSIGLGYAILHEGVTKRSLELSYSAFLATQFHLISHAIFKSLLFLTAGYIIHSYHSRNLLDLKGVARWSKDPIAFLAVWTGSFALIGFPPFNGYWSKESIIGLSYDLFKEDQNLVYTVAYLAALITAFITPLYVAKMVYFLVLSEPDEEKVRTNSYSIMRFVIIILVALTVLAGLLIYKIPDFFTDLDELFLIEGEIHSEYTSISAIVTVIGILISLILGLLVLVPKTTKSDIISTLPIVKWIYTLFKKGFYLDSLWMRLWGLFKWLFYQFRRLHTGDLNYAILGSSIVMGISFLLMFNTIGRL